MMLSAMRVRHPLGFRFRKRIDSILPIGHMSTPQFRKSIANYLETRHLLASHSVENETSVRHAFLNLLDQTSRQYHWTMIPEQTIKVFGGRIIRPDATLRMSTRLTAASTRPRTFMTTSKSSSARSCTPDTPTRTSSLRTIARPCSAHSS